MQQSILEGPFFLFFFLSSLFYFVNFGRDDHAQQRPDVDGEVVDGKVALDALLLARGKLLATKDRHAGLERASTGGQQHNGRDDAPAVRRVACHAGNGRDGQQRVARHQQQGHCCNGPKLPNVAAETKTKKNKNQEKKTKNKAKQKTSGTEKKEKDP